MPGENTILKPHMNESASNSGSSDSPIRNKLSTDDKVIFDKFSTGEKITSEEAKKLLKTLSNLDDLPLQKHNDQKNEIIKQLKNKVVVVSELKDEKTKDVSDQVIHLKEEARNLREKGITAETKSNSNGIRFNVPEVYDQLRKEAQDSFEKEAKIYQEIIQIGTTSKDRLSAKALRAVGDSAFNISLGVVTKLNYMSERLDKLEYQLDMHLKTEGTSRRMKHGSKEFTEKEIVETKALINQHKEQAIKHLTQALDFYQLSYKKMTNGGDQKSLQADMDECKKFIAHLNRGERIGIEN